MNIKQIKTLKIFTFILALFISLGVFTSSFAASAEVGGGGGTTVDTTKNSSNFIPKLVNPLKSEFGGSIENLILSLVDIAIFAGTIVAVFVFIYIGFKFVMAQGSDSAITEAKNWFLYAVIGTALLISSKVIVEIVKNTLVSAGVVDEKIFKR